MKHVPWTSIAAIALPIAVLFGPALFTDRSFALRDAAHFYHPLFEWTSGEWAAGRVPLWNPLENCGTPTLADASSSVFYPGKLVFVLPLDFTLRYKLYVVAHVVLAAAASYWLARAWNASPHAAAVAAIAYSCGGSVVFQYCNVVFLVGAAWLPLAALAAERMLRWRDWRMAVLLGVVLAMMILGGDPQTAYHALLITGLLALFVNGSGREGELEPSRKVVQSGVASVQPQPLRRLRSIFIGLCLTGLAAAVAFSLSAVQVLPSQEATKLSERVAFDDPRTVYEVAQLTTAGPPAGTSAREAITDGLFGTPPVGSHQRLAYDFSVGPWRLPEFFFPNLSGRMFPTHRRWLTVWPLEGRVWTPTLYLGLLPLMLGLAVFRLRGGPARQRWLSWLVLVFTLGSFGWYGGGWIVREVYAAFGGGEIDIGPSVGGVYWLMATLLPGFVYFRYPAKLLVIAALGLSQLAAIGWDRAFDQPRSRLARVLFLFGIGSIAAALVAWFVAPVLLRRLESVDASLGPLDAAGAEFDIVFAFVHAAVVALAGWWLLQRATAKGSGAFRGNGSSGMEDTPPRKTPDPFASRWQTAALLLTAAELAIANYWLVPTAPTSIWRSESAVAQAIHGGEDSVPPRVLRGALAGWRPRSFREQGSADRPAEIARWERDTLFPKHQLASEIALVESYGSIKLVDYESLLYVARQHGPRLADRTALPQPTALRLLGTEFLLLAEASEPAFADRVAGSQELLDWPENASLWRMQRTMPRAWIVHEMEVLPPLAFPRRIAAVDQRTRDVLFPDMQARDFSREAVVETDLSLPDAGAETEQLGEESCRVVRYEPQRVVIEAKLASPGLVILSDAYYPGWKAYVTSHAADAATSPQPQSEPLLRTNRVLRGVWLPAGRHTIEQRYQPASFYHGAWISGIVWLFLVVGVGIWLVRWRN